MPRPNVENERRQQVIEAAMSCFARKGYYLSSMDDIAAELSFSKTLIYYYFRNKREIFLAILDDWTRKSLAAWEMVRSPEEDSSTQLIKGLEYGLQSIVQFRDLARIEFVFLAESSRDDEFRQAIQNLYNKFRDQFKLVLEAGIASGEFQPINPQALSVVLFGAYEGLAMQAIVDPDSLDWPSVLASLRTIIMQGISRRKE